MKKYTLIAILMCFSLLAKAQTSSGKHHIKFLEINSGNPDIGVSFLDDNKIVFATATTSKVKNSAKYNPHLDLYTGTIQEDGAIVDKQRINNYTSRRVSKKGAVYTSDGKTVYFSANKYAKRKNKKIRCELYKASIDASGNWFDIKKLSINDRKSSSNQPALSKDNTKLYFSSNRAGSIGGTDIYVSTINKDGSLSKPKNLGSKINTVGNETTPFIADNNFLYFSSDGRKGGLGGLDVYASEVFENTVSEPLHLDPPINSINDDFAYIINKENKGYFSSNRLQGRGNDDMYSFYIEPEQPKKCLQEIVGTVRETATENLIAEATINVVNEQGKVTQTLKTDKDGNYRFTLSCRNTYTVTATKSQYSKEEHIVNTANYFNAPPLEINQFLTEEIEQVNNDKVVIKVNPIYFRFDKSNINTAASKELDKIVTIMRENPALVIEAASHTDARGSKAYNQKLSERRAKATVNYIVARGISKDRISAKGYGESQLLNNCKDGVRCANDKHKLNRRTEFVITNKHVLNLPKKDKKQVITKAVTTAATNAKKVKDKSVVEGASNDSSKGEIIFIEDEEAKKKSEVETEAAPNDESTNESQKKINTTSFNIQKQNLKLKEKDTKSLQKIVNNTIEDATTKNLIKEEKDLNQKNVKVSNIDQQTVSLKNESVIEKAKKSKVLATKTKKKVTEIQQIKLPEKGIVAKTNTKKEITQNQKVLPDIKTTTASITKLKADKNTVTSLKESRKKSAQKPTLASDFSIKTQNEQVVEKDIVADNKKIKYDTFNTDFSKKKDNISQVSNTLFSDEDDFESFDDKTVTSNRFATKVKRDTKPKTVSLAQKTAEIKRQFIESTLNIDKDEVLIINTINISPMAIKRNGNYIVTGSANKVDVMRINFQIDNNKNITPGYKDVYILIQNPIGTILNRKGSFKVNNGDKLMYTEKTSAYYNNNHLNLSMLTDRFIQRIIKGTYTVIIYIEGYPVGLEMFTLS